MTLPPLPPHFTPSRFQGAASLARRDFGPAVDRRVRRGWQSIHRWPCIAACAGAFAAPSARAEEPIRIGLVAPLSGPSSDFGTSMREGAALAVGEVNSIGGVFGRPLQLVIHDDRGDPATGRAAAVSLVADPRVTATLGYCNTGVALNAVDVFEAARQVLIVPCAQGTAITHRVATKESYVFRVGPSDEMTARFLISEIADRRGLDKVAILADSTAYGEGGVADLSTELRSRKLAPVYVGRFAPDAATLASPLAQARAAGAQALIVYTVGPGEAVAAKGRAAMKWDVPLYGPWTLSFRSVLDQAGAQALEGAMMAQSVIADAPNSTRRTFVSDFARQTHHAPVGSMMAAAQAYDGVHLLVRALYAARGKLDAPSVKQALENPIEPYHGVVTVYDRPFSVADHEALSVNMLWLGVWRAGEIRYFHPEDAKLSAVVRRKSAP